MTVYVHCGGGLVAKLCPNLAIPWTVCSLSGSSVHGILQQEYWSGLPLPSPGIFPTQESNPGLLHCRQMIYQLSYEGSPNVHCRNLEMLKIFVFMYNFLECLILHELVETERTGFKIFILNFQLLNSPVFQELNLPKKQGRRHIGRSIRYSWGFSRQDTGVGCHALLQGIFPTQGSNPGILHCSHILQHLSHQGSP